MDSSLSISNFNQLGGKEHGVYRISVDPDYEQQNITRNIRIVLNKIK